MPAAGCEPAFPSRELPQTDGLDRAATGIGCFIVLSRKNGSITTLIFSIFGTIVIPVTKVQVTIWHQANVSAMHILVNIKLEEEKTILNSQGNQVHPPRRYPYFGVVAGLVWSNDPESYAGSSVYCS
jgi:hypothetical protein